MKTASLKEINEELRKRNFEPLKQPEKPKTRYCSCLLPTKQLRTADDQEFAALSARLILTGSNVSKKLIIPSFEEWMGINVLERDDPNALKTRKLK